MPQEPGPPSSWTPEERQMVSRMRHFKIKDAFTLQDAQNENKVVQSALHIQWSPCNKQALFLWPCRRLSLLLVHRLKGNLLYFYRGATK